MLYMVRIGNETRLEAALRRAAEFNLEEEVQIAYDKAIAEGADEKSAVFSALGEWDLLCLARKVE
jgi:hypothetical protein